MKIDKEELLEIFNNLSINSAENQTIQEIVEKIVKIIENNPQVIKKEIPIAY